MKIKSVVRIKSFTSFTLSIKFFLLLTTYHLPLTTAVYATSINGFYETETDIYKNSDFTWNMALPKHYFQMRYWSNPINGVDLYGQFGARTNEDWNKKYNFELERGWGKFWYPKNEFMFLAKEERHWVSSPLLNLVDTGRARDNSLAIRYDLKDFYGFKATAIASADKPSKHSTGISGQDESEWYGKCFDKDTNVYITKLQKNIYTNQKTLSSCDIAVGYFSRKNILDKYDIVKDTGGAIVGFNGLGNVSQNNEIVSADTKIIFRGTTFTSEFASSFSNNTISVTKNNDAAFSCELRDVSVGPFRLMGKYFDYGKNFRSEISSKFGRRSGDLDEYKEFGRMGYYTEFTFLLPEKLVNLSWKRSDYKTKFDYAYDNQQLRSDYGVVFSSDYFRTVYDYFELYAEFVNGIKGKTGFEIKDNRYGNFPGMFFELSAEDSFAYGRIQARLKDKNSKSDYGERLIYGGELRFNLTDRLQLYWRLVTTQSNLLDKNWSTAFYQLRYNIGWDLETYLEYGDGWVTDNLAWDTDITDTERDMTDVIKLILKVNF